MTRSSFWTSSIGPSASTAAFVQHGDRRSGDAADEVHVVLDHHHGVLAREREEEFRGALGLLVGHAGDRFVEQQQSRLLHQQHADLQPLLLSMGQQPGDAIGFTLQLR